MIVCERTFKKFEGGENEREGEREGERMKERADDDEGKRCR